MDIILNNDDVKRFIFNTKHESYSNETLEIIVQNINCYSILYESLYSITKDIIDIIYNYSKEHYVIDYNFFSLFDRGPAPYYRIREQEIKITFNKITYDTIVYNINLDFYYDYDFFPQIKDYSYILSDGYKRISYKDNADITLIHNLSGNYTLTENNIITIDHLKYSESVPVNVINVLVFVVNKLLKIIIK